MATNILGISAFYHDSAAALISDGHIMAAAQEERYTRKKHDPSFPKNAIIFCLQAAKLKLTDLNYIVFYDKPLLKFERLLETYLAFAPSGFRSFTSSMPIWLKEKLFLKTHLKQELAWLGSCKIKALPRLLFTEHHQAHAASAFFASPFQRAAVLCLDGVGEWATSSAWLGNGNQLLPQWELDFPHSLGLLYSAFTYYLGFKVNSGEYKLMGLAPYGEPKYVKIILENLLDLKEDGTFRLNLEYFNFPTGLTMTNRKFHDLFGGPPRKGESEISQKHMDIASSIQVVTEEILLKLAFKVHRELKTDYLCLAGGVALNCVANGKLLRQGPFKDIWIQPAAGDAGGALGAALSGWYEYLGNDRFSPKSDSMCGSYLGPSFPENEIKKYLNSINASYEIENPKNLAQRVAEILAQGNVVGYFQGRMEFGPRALGARSILGDARCPKMQSIMNLKIKYRESFRPFAPAVNADSVQNWFELDRASPYMLLVAEVQKNKRIPKTLMEENLFGIDKLHVKRSEIPAVTHVDYSARIQTVHPETNPNFYTVLEAFEAITGCPVLINTSFNVRGEPIVCTPKDAYRCFMRTEMDYLIMENIILKKNNQPQYQDTTDWIKEFLLN